MVRPQLLHSQTLVRSQAKSNLNARKLLKLCRYKVRVHEDDIVYYYSKGLDEFAVARALILKTSGVKKEASGLLAKDKQVLYTIMDFLANGTMEKLRMGFTDILSAFLSIEREKWNGMSKRLIEVDGWLSLMPLKWDRERVIALSVYLGRVTSPPESGRLAILERCKRCSPHVRRLMKLEGRGEIRDYLDAFIEYYNSPPGEEVVQKKDRKRKRKKEAIEESEDVVIETVGKSEAHLEQLSIPKPHESLVFSPDTLVALINEGLHPEDVRRVIVYGLRLASRKAAIGGVYFETVFFMDNAERVLEKNDREIPIRVKEIRDFLLRHGVISYYKQGDTIRLNMKKEDQKSTLTQLGSQMLDAVKARIHEFQRQTETAA